MTNVATHSYRCLITGCGRSGTRYISLLVNELGLRIGHERPAEDGVASWLMAWDDTEAPAYAVPRGGMSFQTVLHQVRHPLRVIPSVTTFTDESWRYIARHVPCSPDDPPLLRAAKYWVCWNEQAQRLAQWTYRVEALPEVFDEFCRRLGVVADRDALRRVSVRTNSRAGPRWLRLVRAGVEQLDLRRAHPLPEVLERTAANAWSPPGGQLTWEALEEQAPGWSSRVMDRARSYGYTADDDARALD